MTDRQKAVLLKVCYEPSQVMQAFYKMLHILSCLDFGYFEYKSAKAKVFWKLITVLCSASIIGLGLILMEHRGTLPWFLINFSYYFINVLFLICISSNKTVCQLHRDLQAIDTKLRVSSASYKLEIKLMSCAIFGIVLQIIMYTLFCGEKKDCVRPLIIRYVFLWLMVSLNIVPLSCAFAFYSLTCRLWRFLSILQTENRDNMSMQLIYKSIVDLAEMQKSASSPMVS